MSGHECSGSGMALAVWRLLGWAWATADEFYLPGKIPTRPLVCNGTPPRLSSALQTTSQANFGSVAFPSYLDPTPPCEQNIQEASTIFAGFAVRLLRFSQGIFGFFPEWGVLIEYSTVKTT